MPKDDERTEPRERSRRSASAESRTADTGGAGSEVERVQNGGQSPMAALRAMRDKEQWLRPLRAALPKLQSIRNNMARTPRVDVIEREGDVVVRAAVPGMAKDVIDLALTNSTLTIRGTAPTAEKEGHYVYHELPQGGFERRVSLPCEVQAEKAAATVRDGILELVLPKANRVRPQAITIR